MNVRFLGSADLDSGLGLPQNPVNDTQIDSDILTNAYNGGWDNTCVL